MTRALVLDELAARITRIVLPRPLRVAIDGRMGSGKTIVADELANCMSRQRPADHPHVDRWVHRSKAERYARGRNSPEGYYYDSRDLDAVLSLLLVPLGPGGNRRYRTASFDLENDRPVRQEPTLAETDAILIVDGTFLQRPELRDGRDLAIFVKASKEIATRRGIARDAEQLGGTQAARQLYAERYDPACDLYEGLCGPEPSADAVVNNDDLENPRLTIRPDGRLVTPKPVT